MMAVVGAKTSKQKRKARVSKLRLNVRGVETEPQAPSSPHQKKKKKKKKKNRNGKKKLQVYDY